MGGGQIEIEMEEGKEGRRNPIGQRVYTQKKYRVR